MKGMQVRSATPMQMIEPSWVPQVGVITTTTSGAVGGLNAGNLNYTVSKTSPSTAYNAAELNWTQ